MNTSTEKTKVSTRRKVYRITIVLTLLYCSVGIALYHLQEKLLFHPKALPQDFQFKFDVPFKEVNIPMTETENLNLIQFFPTDSTRKGVVIYFHGNSDNVIRYARHATNFTKDGYEVWMPDYPTYGKTTGKLNEETFYR